MTDTPAPLLDVARPARVHNIPQTVAAMKAAGGSPAGFFFEWLKLRLGRNRLPLSDYLTMKLWDKTLYSGAKLDTFTGKSEKAREIYRAANFIPEVQALAGSKLASNAILTAHGLPVVPLLGLHTARAFPGPGRTATPEALASFLLNDLSYPAFGKPLWGIQSLGSVSLSSRDAAAGTVTLQNGGTVEALRLAREIHAAYFMHGYIFQPRLAPHPDVKAVCGDRLATVRVLTAERKAYGPCVLRTCWKIPAGASNADNFWRAGNILAGIDAETGAVTRAVTGSGSALREVETHPDTGARLPGLAVPLWEDICRTALFGATAMSGFWLLGWDIAATADGSVILDVNEKPDFVMHQMADRRGVIDETFAEFLADRRAERRDWNRRTREDGRNDLKASYDFSAPEK
ncbi:MAG: hypothetical protein KGQ70_07770 [Alphaproteobacteria bacterium]|nr:hypothetical protein [Alphaproteobacteria bacterium]